MKRKVFEVLLHLHLDEMFAYFLGCRFGKEIFVGMETARLNFSPPDILMTPDQWAASNRIYLGGGGDETDEHRSGQTERLAGWSASRLMARKLALNGQIERIVAEVNRFDSRAGCPKSHLASLVKMIRANMPGAEQIGFRWGQRIIGSVHDMIAADLRKPARNEPAFDEFMGQLIESRGDDFNDESAAKGLKAIIDGESYSTEPLVFSLRSVFEALWRTAQGTAAEKAAAVREDMLFTLQVLYRDQMNFHAFRRLASSKDFEDWFCVDVWNGRQIVKVRAAAVSSDNPQAHNALRSLGAGLSIVRSGTGNVTVLGNVALAEKMGILEAMDAGIRNVAAMNRYCDMPPEAREVAVWEVMSCRGRCPYDGHWYLAEKDWLSCYNGTQNHAVPPTRLALKSIRKNAEQAFHPESVKRWKRTAAVPSDEWFRSVADLDVSAWAKPISMEDQLFPKAGKPA